MPSNPPLPWPEAIDTSMDWELWPNYITVQWLSKTAEAPPAYGQSVEHVMWFQIKKDKLAADSPLMKFERTFRVGRIPLGDIVPKANDIIVDDWGVRWVVGLVEILSYGNEFRCHCNKGAIQNVPVNT